MNILKVQTDFLKKIYMGKRVMFVDEYEGKIGITDGYVVCLIDKQHFFLRADLVESRPLMERNPVVTSLPQAKLAKRDNQLKAFEKPKKTFVRFYTDTEEAHVDIKQTAYFDKNAEYHIVDKEQPVFVYECNKLVGIVMPCTVKGLDKMEGVAK